MQQLKVRDLMKTDLVSVGPGDSVARVRDLMYERWVRFIPVIDDGGRLLGLVTYRDLLRRSLIEQSDRPVWVEQEALEKIPADAVAQHVVDQVEPDADLQDAGRQLMESKKGCLLVVEADRLVGILTESDFVRYLVGDPPI
jgi:CBS domain-containing membrane protein